MILKDKTFVITGILTDKSIAFAAAKIAIDNGAKTWNYVHDSVLVMVGDDWKSWWPFWCGVCHNKRCSQ